jgi:hypothetical protein
MLKQIFFFRGAGAPIRNLRQIRRVRKALQHTGSDSGLAAELSQLEIRDAPPNWSAAWDQIRAIAADSLHDLRRLLSRELDRRDT